MQIPYPMVLRRGNKGFARLSWEQALDLIADEMKPIAPERMAFFTWHKTIGATILILTLVRLGYRVLNPPPPYPEEMPAWRRTAAAWSHRLLYFLLIALPLTGLIARQRHVTAVRKSQQDPHCCLGASWDAFLSAAGHLDDVVPLGAQRVV